MSYHRTNVYTDDEVADRYGSARDLPIQTQALWSSILKEEIAGREIKTVLDLGCGTGRFTPLLRSTFECSVFGVEPSTAMLDVARLQQGIEWKHGDAEHIPLRDLTIDLVFMSQVFHHLIDPARAIAEIERVLAPEGALAIRSGVREHNSSIEWLRFFPEASDIEQKRMPTRQEIIESVSSKSLELKSHRTVIQRFADSYEEYYKKISCRALSALVLINDDAFHAGLLRFKNWAARRPRETPVYEPVDLFVFSKKTV